jgi:hypothetical protein
MKTYLTSAKTTTRDAAQVAQDRREALATAKQVEPAERKK